MSRRKDRERLQKMKLISPDYEGYRGPEKELHPTPLVQTKPVICARCGRKRNAPANISEEEERTFICTSCREELGEQEKK